MIGDHKCLWKKQIEIKKQDDFERDHRFVVQINEEDLSYKKK